MDTYERAGTIHRVVPIAHGILFNKKAGKFIMMRLLANKKNVKITSVIVAGVFVIGVGGLAFMQMGSTVGAAPASDIGVVDTAKVIEGNMPLIQKATTEMNEYSQSLQEKFQKESANMDDQQKQKLMMELQADMQKKQIEIQKNMEDELKKATAAVAEAKGLKAVLTQDAVLYGGTDITPLVAKKMAKEATADKK